VTTADATAAWLAPQQRFDALQAEARRRHPRGLCDLAYANAWSGPAEGVKDALRAALDTDRNLDLQYTPYGGATIARRTVARWLDGIVDNRGRHHFKNVVLTPGAMAALAMTFKALAPEAGDEILIPTPCWLDYPLYMAQQGIVPRLVPLTGDDLVLDLDAIAAAIGPRTRALVLSQPANPTGRVWSADELGALGALLDHRGVRLISDECHRLLSSVPVTAGASVVPSALTVFSFGKGLSLQGQRIGFVAVSPDDPGREALRDRLTTLARAMGFCTPTALMQRALPALLKLTPEVGELDAMRDRARSALTGAGFKVPRSDASFFLYPAVRGGDDEAFAARAAERGVLVLPGSIFHHRGHVRLSLTERPERLDDGLEVLTSLGPS
jgi:aspartate aminotransferase